MPQHTYKTNASNPDVEDHPSMEEILRSIRGVITGHAPERVSQDDNVLELTEVVDDSALRVNPAPPPYPSKSPSEPQSTASIEELKPPTNSQRPSPTAHTRATSNKETFAQTAQTSKPNRCFSLDKKREQTEQNAPASANLINKPTAEKSAEALKELIDKTPKTAQHSPSLRSAITVEDLVVEALRPALAEWLNNNLATMVKELVEKEIKKLIPQDEKN